MNQTTMNKTQREIIRRTKALGWTAYKLAQLSRVNRPAVEKYLAGRGDVKVTQAEAMLAAIREGERG